VWAGATRYHDGNPARTIALVHDLLILGAFQFARAALDGTLDIISRHVMLPRLFDGEPQPWVRIGVAATQSRRHDNLACQLGEQLAAHRVLLRFANADIVPLRMSRHCFPLLWLFVFVLACPCGQAPLESFYTRQGGDWQHRFS
jgi:hypothetical protein